MKKDFIILIVEDLKHEIFLAKRAVDKANCFCITVENLEDAKNLLKMTKEVIFGAVTGLHFPKSEKEKDGPDKLNGLDFTKLCVEQGIRVAVCSDSSSHFESSIKRLSEHPACRGNKIPLCKKDWDGAITELLKIK